MKPSQNIFGPRPLDGRKTPLSKKTASYVLVYIQQFGAENISVKNTIFVIAFRTLFEKSGGAIAPASPMAVGCLTTPLHSPKLWKYFVF